MLSCFIPPQRSHISQCVDAVDIDTISAAQIGRDIICIKAKFTSLQGIRKHNGQRINAHGAELHQ